MNRNARTWIGVAVVTLIVITVGREALADAAVAEGVIKAKGRTWIRVLSKGDAEARRYTPRWVGGMPRDGGGLEKSMLREISRMRVGDKIKFKWITDERRRIVEVIEHESSGEGDIGAGKGEYRRREGEKWRKQGRIVGRLIRAPEGEIDVLNKGGKIVKSVRLRRGARGYEIEWLEPGAYTLRVAAKGYKPFVREGLKVKAGHDLCLLIEFSRRSEEGEGGGLPEGVRGFRGMLAGKVVEKDIGVDMGAKSTADVVRDEGGARDSARLGACQIRFGAPPSVVSGWL